MLNCVYHFTGDMQVVDNDDKDKLLESGAWFDHPNKAKAYREQLEQMDVNSPVPKKRKAKKKEDSHEK